MKSRAPLKADGENLQLQITEFRRYSPEGSFHADDTEEVEGVHAARQAQAEQMLEQEADQLKEKKNSNDENSDLLQIWAQQVSLF